MEFSVVQSFNSYIDAHILLSRLESEGIECWLQDENTVTINPILTNAVGGIKLLVNQKDFSKAMTVFSELENIRKATAECPVCGSHNVELVSTPRKASNWISAISTFFLGDFALTVNKVYHCFDCKNEFPSETEQETDT
jgi:DNA-directed RNA polymerase subunit RPC12/RpoP